MSGLTKQDMTTGTFDIPTWAVKPDTTVKAEIYFLKRLQQLSEGSLLMLIIKHQAALMSIVEELRAQRRPELTYYYFARNVVNTARHVMRQRAGPKDIDDYLYSPPMEYAKALYDSYVYNYVLQDMHAYSYGTYALKLVTLLDKEVENLE